MANCDNLFRHYNSIIKLSDDKWELLKTVRDGLRTRMHTRYDALYEEQIGRHSLEFYSQGSFVMDTIITPKDDDFDLDDGVYFIGNLSKEKRPPVNKLHEWVAYSVNEDEDYGVVTDKDTCVRVNYKKEKFHIDLPIYYATNEDPDLAHKTLGWMISNPIKFIAWFEDKVQSGFKESFLIEARLFTEFEKWTSDIRKADAQLRRIVRYLKGWADNLRGEMPPGIIMTILAAENYVGNERDDMALRDTLIKIKSYLDGNGFKCLRPTVPVGDGLFESYSDTKKQYFRDRLQTFIDSANQAIANSNQKEACLKWQRHLGDRFPCSLAKDELSKPKNYEKPAIIGDTARSA